ncbi:hypothetical protein X474_12810 [Dethiosulfatarculus sandiegensis]|uniref:Uncharacterized protein n=1 Tax=Dethiosulfatarculus sandiegensis TaxID=1429043 RepID=A0A0D2HU48_9BACT|nr:hypothetical protein X474_12810 [Dethiosulfatarculus sandiegensis]
MGEINLLPGKTEQLLALGCDEFTGMGRPSVRFKGCVQVAGYSLPKGGVQAPDDKKSILSPFYAPL